MTEQPGGRTATMRVVAYRRYGPPDVLRLEEAPRPEPGAGDILVRVHATAVTPSDCAFRKADPVYARLAVGLTRPRSPVLGDLLAGEVEAVGEGVTRFGKGDRVIAVTGMGFGAYAEYTSLSEEGVLPLPPAMSYEDAVAVVDGGLTALPFLRDHADLRSGQRILVNGASGAVGVAAVQLAKHFGAVVTGVCGAANTGFVADLGADEVIDYTEEDFTRSGRTYDVVFDAVGKSSFSRCARVLNPAGRYLTTVPSLAIGFQTLWTARVGSRKADLALTGLRSSRDKATDIAFLTGLAEAGEIRPVIDRRYTLEQTSEAHRYVDTERKRGSVLLTI